MVGQEAVQSQSWWETIKSSLQLDKLMSFFNEYKENILTAAFFLGIGFLSGFITKKFSTAILFLILFISVLVILHQFGIIHVTIDFIKINQFFGFTQLPTVEDNVLLMIWSWIKVHWVLTVSYGIGFLLGIKCA